MYEITHFFRLWHHSHLREYRSCQVLVHMRCKFCSQRARRLRSFGKPVAHIACAARGGGRDHFGDGLLQHGNRSGRDNLDFLGQHASSSESVMKGLDLGNAIDLTPVQGGQEESAINYDPEGLFSGTSTTMQDGHIERRALMRKVESGEELDEAMDAQKEKALAEAQERREATEMPTSAEDVIGFLMGTHPDDLEYFVAKCRPLLTAEFFSDLDGRIGHLRFLAEDEQEGLEELLGLREYVTKFLAAQDSVNKGVMSVTERLKKLLTAKDKKQTILDMAAANEIDVGLVSLLQQNIVSAERAGQAQAVEFMTKIKNACSKYLIAPSTKSEESSVRAALEQEKKNASNEPKLIMPN